jgi:hypothetical protein
MARLTHSFIMTGAVWLLVACNDYFRMDPKIPVSQQGSSGGNVNCKAPPIEQNIVGTWNFVSNHNHERVERRGTVTFDAQKRVIDPDSLFENRLDDRFPVNRKTYVPVAQRQGYVGDLFEIQLYSQTGGYQSPVFRVLSNECKKIHLTEATNQQTEITLTR